MKNVYFLLLILFIVVSCERQKGEEGREKISMKSGYEHKLFFNLDMSIADYFLDKYGLVTKINPIHFDIIKYPPNSQSPNFQYTALKKFIDFYLPWLQQAKNSSGINEDAIFLNKDGKYHMLNGYQYKIENNSNFVKRGESTFYKWKGDFKTGAGSYLNSNNKVDFSIRINYDLNNTAYDQYEMYAKRYRQLSKQFICFIQDYRKSGRDEITIQIFYKHKNTKMKTTAIVNTTDHTSTIISKMYNMAKDERTSPEYISYFSKEKLIESKIHNKNNKTEDHEWKNNLENKSLYAQTNPESLFSNVFNSKSLGF